MSHSGNPHPRTDSDSDDEDIAARLSPSDGFTSPSSYRSVPYVPNIMIDDPTVQQRKAHEADEEQHWNSQGDQQQHHVGTAAIYSPNMRHNANHKSSPQDFSHTYTYAPSSSTSQISSQARQPQACRAPSVHSEAPPAYSPLPTSPYSLRDQQQQGRTRNYSTFLSSTGGTPGQREQQQQQRWLARAPESMADYPGGEESFSTPVWSQQGGSRVPRWLSWKTTLLALLVVVVTFGLLASSFREIKGGREAPVAPEKPAQPGVGAPVRPGNPGGNGPHGADDMPFSPGACRDAEFRYPDRTLPLVFSRDRNVAFVEEIDEHPRGRPVRVVGHVRVREVDEDGDPRILLEMASNDEDLQVHVFADEATQTMRVRVPHNFGSGRERQPCVVMRATIFVPRGADIDNFTVGTTHLDILLIEDLSLKVAGISSISSVAGDVASASSYPPTYGESGGMHTKRGVSFIPAKDTYQFDSRHIKVTTTSGDIVGNWPLYDALSLHTTSGVIKTSVTPKEALKSNPQPAVLSLSSVSGDIQVAQPVYGGGPQIPPRDYRVDAGTTSGNFHGHLAIGGALARLHSISGEVTADLLPVLNRVRATPRQPARLETSSTSGITGLDILEPRWVGGDDGDDGDSRGTRILDCFQASHKSTSGDIHLRYPQSWEGDLFAESMSGDLKVRGRDVRIVRSSKGWPHSLQARKGGNGDDEGDASLIRVHTMSGDLNAIIGDER